MDYAKIYPGDELAKFDGAKNLEQGHLKYGDALAAICYAHGISYDDITYQWPQVKNNERFVGGDVQSQMDFVRTKATRTPQNILEIGAGRGEVSLFLTNMGYSVTALDPGADFEQLLQQSNSKLFPESSQMPSHIINKPLHLADIDYSKYDTILMVESLEHILAEHFDPQYQLIKQNFKGRLCITNWLVYHPIAIGQYAHRDLHCRLVDDALYNQYCADGEKVYRNRSHLCVDYK